LIIKRSLVEKRRSTMGLPLVREEKIQTLSKIGKFISGASV
jgi:hypothetical protein